MTAPTTIADVALAAAELRRMADNFAHKAAFYEDGIAGIQPDNKLHPWRIRASSLRKIVTALRSRATRLEKGTAAR